MSWCGILLLVGYKVDKSTDNSSANMLQELIAADRKLELDYEYACAESPEMAQQIRTMAASYLTSYAAFNGITVRSAIESYSATVRQYANDIRVFIATGRYPLEINPVQRPLSRMDYDLFLMLTILVTRHRCALMEELVKFAPAGKALVIGVGSGIELTFLGESSSGEAYDLYINPYARKAFPAWTFCEEMYRPKLGRRYDVVYAIELLEHLERPYEFLTECRDSVVDGGLIVATTATNVPQFDHRYNFTSDQDFERRVGDLGLEVEHKRVVPHAYPRTNIDARNVFYVLRKLE